MTVLKGKNPVNGKQFEILERLARRNVYKSRYNKTEKARKLRHRQTRTKKIRKDAQIPPVDFEPMMNEECTLTPKHGYLQTRKRTERHRNRI